MNLFVVKYYSGLCNSRLLCCCCICRCIMPDTVADPEKFFLFEGTLDVSHCNFTLSQPTIGYGSVIISPMGYEVQPRPKTILGNFIPIFTQFNARFVHVGSWLARLRFTELKIKETTGLIGFKVTLHAQISNWRLNATKRAEQTRKFFKRIKPLRLWPHYVGRRHKNDRGRPYNANICLIKLVCLSPNFHENMHDFHSPHGFSRMQAHPRSYGMDAPSVITKTASNVTTQHQTQMVITNKSPQHATLHKMLQGWQSHTVLIKLHQRKRNGCQWMTSLLTVMLCYPPAVIYRS